MSEVDEMSAGSLGYADARPPLGVMPKTLWVEDRVNDILEAMERYRRGKYIIPAEWAEELAEHLRTLERDR